MFWKKKNVNSAEYESLLKRLLEVRHEIEDVKAEMKALETSYNDLRGKFNRKLYKMTPEDDKSTPENSTPQSLNTFNPFK